MSRRASCTIWSFTEHYESMQFLIDRGIDMTIKDYRWNSTAQGWALLRREGREDGPVAGGGGTAAETVSARHNQRLSSHDRRESKSTN